MRRERFEVGAKLATIYLRVPVELRDRVQAIADRPPDGGRPQSVNRLLNRLLRKFVESLEGGQDHGVSGTVPVSAGAEESEEVASGSQAPCAAE